MPGQPFASQCPPRETLVQLLKRRLNAEQAAVWTDHVASCPSCESKLSEIAAANPTVAENPEAPVDPEGRGRPKASPGRRPDPRNLTATDTLRDAANHAREPALLSPRSRIGRYRIEKLLGRGSYGDVYLAQDEELERWVAIKVLRQRLESARQTDRFLHEARIAAALKHQHIVTVYDVIQEHGGCWCLIYAYVEGQSLRRLIERSTLSHERSAELIAAIAGAVHQAHKQGIIHRDIKPDNILVDNLGQPFVTDFGLALHESLIGNAAREVVGTPAYMSPEQVRGETHRFDGRTDIWALGVTLYEMLTGRRPFHAIDRPSLYKDILTAEPKPPRQLDDGIPIELERICLKCLTKQMTGRYTTALELAEELRQWKHGGSEVGERLPAPVDAPAEPSSTMVVPKGLRAFGRQDSNGFLELLPGPIERDGLPASIHFWKVAIEEMEPPATFAVGVLYGPSGCGKTSLVKAGLLPRLDRHVKAVYVECSPDQTVSTLLGRLRRLSPELPQHLGLTETLLWLRTSPLIEAGSKVLIVLDQFEQWLHAHPAQEESELSQALRHCDGGHLQTLLLVRDDFGMALARFMDRLELPLVQGENFATIDLFSREHALHVMEKFGQALNRLPANSDAITVEQRRFMGSIIKALSEHDQIVPVRLSVFVDMFRNKPWTEKSLKALGGPEGVDVALLEEMFHARSANPMHRRYAQAAERVLQRLLPEPGRNLRGSARSVDELAEAAAMPPASREMRELMRILEAEVRLVMPVGTDTESEAGLSSGSSTDQVYYQLTHDFLIAPLRRWLSSKQRETLRGRFQLRLEECAAIWSINRKNDRLPRWWEWVVASTLVPPAQRSGPARQMMDSATRFYRRRFATIAAAVLLLVWVGWRLRRESIEAAHRGRAQDLVERLLVADTTEVPGIVEQLQPHRTWAEPELHAAQQKSSDRKTQLHLSLARLPYDAGEMEHLLDQVGEASLDELLVVRRMLEDHRQPAAEKLWAQAEHTDTPRNERLRAACLLAQLDAGSPRWSAVSTLVAKALVAENWLAPGGWIQSLESVGSELVDPLVALMQDPDQPPEQRFVAASALARYAADDAGLLVELLVEADNETFPSLLAGLESQPSRAMSDLQQVLQERPERDWLGSEKADEKLPEPILERLRDASGLATDSFALCQRTSLEGFDALCASLASHGYRLACFRPYRTSSGLWTAAIWIRSAENHLHRYDLSIDQLRQEHDDQEAGKLQILDLAAYEGPEGQMRYAAVWAPPDEDRLDTAMYCGVGEAEHHSQWQPLNQGGFVPRTNFLTIDRQTGSALYNSVRWKLRHSPGYRDAWGSSDDPAETSASMCRADYRFEQGPSDTVRHSTVWWDGSRYESEEVHAVGAEQHLEGCRRLSGLGYRPVSISAAPDESGRVASVWHRPLIAHTERDRIARRQANAALALLALGQEEAVWPLLRHSPEPHVRHWFIRRFAERGMISPGVLIGRLPRETDASIQMAMLNALSLCPSDTISGALSSQATYAASNLLEQTSDPGVRAAAEHLLEKIGGLTQVEVDPASKENKPRWIQDGQGHTLSIIEAPVEFIQGSSGVEPRRDHFLEQQRKVRIERSYALASKEVTLEQFLRFKPTHGFSTTYGSDERGPVTTVTWWDAVRYCRWLSEQEQIPEDQMCYPPLVEISKDGMQLPGNWHARTGYRLPTEAEWEYACRAGTESSRYFGDSADLLSDYGWTVANSGYRTHPAGALLPNRFGLFDMLGNVMEWCHDNSDRPDIAAADGSLTVDSKYDRILRGGAFLFEPSTARAAFRGRHKPTATQPYVGFRVARTMPE